LILANNRTIMGRWTNKAFQNVFAIAMTVMIFGITIVLFMQPFLK